jgi:hypothetical protein
MASSAAIFLVLALCVLGANLPFLNERVFAVGPRRAPKSMGLRLLEMLVYLGLVIAAGIGLEARAGQVHSQGWQFYAVMVCIFLTVGSPGFVWRYLRRQPARPAEAVGEQA